MRGIKGRKIRVRHANRKKPIKHHIQQYCKVIEYLNYTYPSLQLANSNTLLVVIKPVKLGSLALLLTILHWR
jgi:hypothetical protein